MKHPILHIEDDPSLAKLIKRAFEGFGFKGEMLTVGSVHEALATLAERARLQRPLSLILSDMQLPDGTGLEVISAVKSDPAWRLTPVVVLSGEKSRRVINDAYAMGANCFLPKIPKTKTVLAMLQSLYECWLDSAALPEEEDDGNRLQTILARMIYFRARQADVYMSLSQAFADDPLQMEFWLGRALNEGNFSNIVAFFKRTLGEHELPPGAIGRIDQMHAQVDAALHAAERALKENPRPTVDDSLAMVLDIHEALDETLFAEMIGHTLPRNPVAAEALRSALVDHFTEIALFIGERAAQTSLRERATALVRVVKKLKAAGPA